MAEKKPGSARIPASQLPPVKNWHLPRVSGGHVVRSPFQEKKGSGTQVRVQDDHQEVEPLTVEAIEKIRQQAHDEGYKEGHSSGLETGLAEGRAKGEELGHKTGLQRAQGEIDALKAKLANMMTTLDTPLQQQQQELEDILLRMVLDMAQTVVKAELASRPELLQSAIQESLKTLPHADQGLSFTINPDDLEMLESLRDQEQADWQLRTDETLTPGGLLIKGVNSHVDYTVEGRFNEVTERWLNAVDADTETDKEAGESGEGQ